MLAFKRVTKDGKTIYCYGFNKTQVMNVFDPAKFSSGRFEPDPISTGLCIEPLSGEYLMHARQDMPVGLPANEFQNNTVCLFFARQEAIDMMIEKLQGCKQELAKKSAAARHEEYRKRYYGKVVYMRDLIARKQMLEEATEVSL